MESVKTIRLYGARATGIEIGGELHHDATDMGPSWLRDEDDARGAIEETARLTGCDPAQHFSLISLDLDLPTWWDDLDEAMQNKVLDAITERLDDYPGGCTTVEEWTGDEFADTDE